MDTTGIRVIDTHTEGMPTRVVVDGVGDLPGSTMQQRREHLLTERSDLRTFLVCEPRGHQAMTAALLQTPCRPDADVGVVWMEASGCIASCGHGAMGVAAALVATGRIPAVDGGTVVRLDTPAGLVEARVQVEDGRIGPVTIRLLPSFVVALDQTVQVPGHGVIEYDLAYGGNHCVIADLPQFGLELHRSAAEHLRQAGLAVVATVAEQHRLTHPDGRPAELRHAQLVAAGSTARHSRHVMVIAPGWFDRSPCGTGTAARLAQLHHRGLLPLHRDLVQESFIGTRFTGRLVAHEHQTVLPEITGRAFVTGTAELVLDPDDPFPAGFIL